MSLLPAQFSPPPLPRSLLRLPVIENGYAVRVLQIVRGADPVFRVPAIGLATPCKPSASAGPPAGSPARNPSPGRANRARCGSAGEGGQSGSQGLHRAPCVPFSGPSTLWGVFGEYLWTNLSVPPRTKVASNIDGTGITCVRQKSPSSRYCLSQG